MSDYTHTGLELVGRHVPDPAGGPFNSMADARDAGHDVLNPVTGMYEIGVVIEGAFVPIITEKASLVFDRIDAARSQQTADQSAQPQQPPAGQPADQGGQLPSGPQSDLAQPQG